MKIFLEIIKTLIKFMLGRGSYRSYGQFGEDAIIQPLLRQKMDSMLILGHTTQRSIRIRMDFIDEDGVEL